MGWRKITSSLTAWVKIARSWPAIMLMVFAASGLRSGTHGRPVSKTCSQERTIAGRSAVIGMGERSPRFANR